ncbi:response regulator transcription factor [Marispirochaeta aestuarii]|uniref:response regulator transcription factor n=1 Tax=Marispirochaeta aestuarii TaxID=1963862 RepID=UPI0029C889A6|nr:response regulator transcription factor [Marispirochaeta aestuarii]
MPQLGETVLIIDDEQYIRELLEYNLEKEGYSVIPAASGEEGLDLARRNHPALIILDLMLPGIDGIDVCRRLKKDPRTADIPIIMASAKGEDADIVVGLEIGADDYITKPFSPRVLGARIRAVLRRKDQKGLPRENESSFSIHGISVDTKRHQVHCGGDHVNLSVTEFSILEFLARNAGWVFSRNQIIGAVKGESYPVTERAVDVQILGLRKKLGDYGRYIETIRGVGYRMREESIPSS